LIADSGKLKESGGGLQLMAVYPMLKTINVGFSNNILKITEMRKIYLKVSTLLLFLGSLW